MKAQLLATVATALVCAGVMAMTACTEATPSGKAGVLSKDTPAASSTKGPGAPKLPVDIPYAEGAEAEVKVFAKLRGIDPCALLNPAVVERITHDTADRILPEGDLGSCILDVAKSRYKPTWQLSVDLGKRYDAEAAVEDHQDTAEMISGVQFYRQKMDDAKGFCIYVRQVDGDYSVKFTVSSRGNAPAAQPCEVAKQYLTATAAARWRQMPQRTDQLTIPQLPLANHDPCAATKTISRALKRPLKARLIGLYRCSLAPDTGTSPPGAGPAERDLTITYLVDRNPAAQSGSSAAADQTIEGHQATRTELKGTGCTVDVVADQDDTTGRGQDEDAEAKGEGGKGTGSRPGGDKGSDRGLVVIRDENDEWVQTISVRTSTCEEAVTAAAEVIKHLTSR